MRTRTAFAPLFVVVALAHGCSAGREQPPFPELHPVKGTVQKGKAPVSGGLLQFTRADDNGEFLVNSEVAADGTFSLSTVRATDTRGERKPGAPAGAYKVTYSPPYNDQTAGAIKPIVLPQQVTVQPGENNLTVEVPAAKK